MEPLTKRPFQNEVEMFILEQSVSKHSSPGLQRTLTVLSQKQVNLSTVWPKTKKVTLLDINISTKSYSLTEICL